MKILNAGWFFIVVKDLGRETHVWAIPNIRNVSNNEILWQE
jgi:hypothetical protein